MIGIEFMYTYQIKLRTTEGKYETKEIEGCDPGNAFAKCQKANPGAVMLQAECRSKNPENPYRGAVTRYEALPIQRDPVKEPRPARPPKPKERDGIMPFYDEVVKR